MAPLKRLFFSEYLVLILSVLYFAIFAPFTPGFASLDNLVNVVAALLPLFALAMGQTIVLITAGIDLSVTSTVALCSITGAAVMSNDHGWLAGSPLAVPVALVAMLTLGGLVGLGNGISITGFKMPPFIVTLTAMMFLSGLAIWLTKSKNVGSLPAGFSRFAGNVFLACVLVTGLGLSAHVMLGRSLWGRWLYAVGHNACTSRISGVPVTGVVISAYVLSGTLAAVASVLYTAQAETGSPVMAQRHLLDVVGATVIGGTSLFGGRGKIAWTLFGVIFLKLIDNILNLLDLSYFSIMMVKGGVILFAALLDAIRNRTPA